MNIREPIVGIPGNFAMLGVFEKASASVVFTARSGCCCRAIRVTV